MRKKPTTTGSASHLHLWRWVAKFGTAEIGYCGPTRSFIRVLDEGGIVWKGHQSYPSLEAAPADAAGDRVALDEGPAWDC